MAQSLPEVLPVSAASLAKAGELIRLGKLVAFPTETVYGLGADATDDRAVASIFAAKGRPNFNPLIVHVTCLAEADPLVEVDDRARKLIDRFWPGPLTVILPRRENSPVSLLVSAGLSTVAMRCPSHPVARALIEAAKRPIAAPSANRSGTVSPTTPQHVVESLGANVHMVLAAGRSAVGVESTILDLTHDEPVLLRPGAVLREDIAATLGQPVAASAGNPQTPNAPGQLTSHYAPSALVRLNAESADDEEAFLTFGPDYYARGGKERLNLSPTGSLEEAAANLFTFLHKLDKTGARRIAVMPIPETGLGVAINDRLKRAAAPRG